MRGVGTSTPSRIAVVSSATSVGVKPKRAASWGSTSKLVAGPLIGVVDAVLDVYDAGYFLDFLGDASGEIGQLRGVVGEELDLDGFGCVREVTDVVLQDLRELDIELGFLLFDLRSYVGHHLVDAALAIFLEDHGDVAIVGLGHGGEAHLQAGAAAGVIDLRGLHEDLVNAREHLVGGGDGASGGHDVVEDEAAFVHLREQVGTERVVAEVRSRH